MITCCFDYVEGSDSWIDERGSSSQKRVFHKRSGDEYGMLKDSDLEIRYKMFGLCAISPAIFFSRAIFRLAHLLSGQWAFGQGYTRALKTWRLERYHAPVDEAGKKLNAPGQKTLWVRTALYAACYFADALAKCVTLPIAALLAVTSTLIAIGDPLLARRCYAWVEEAWSLEFEKKSSLHFLNYSAPCMQPKRIWDQIDLYPSIKERNDPKRLYSYMLQINHLLDSHREYFTQTEYELLSNHLSRRSKQIKDDLVKYKIKEETESYCANQLKELENMLIGLERFAQHLVDLAESDVTEPEAKIRNKTNLYQHLNLPHDSF